MSPTDHDRIVTVEGLLKTLCSDMEDTKDDRKEFREFMTEVRTTVALVKWQIALSLGNGVLLVYLLAR